MLLSGLMMPYDMLPASAQAFARLFPATYGMIGYKALAYATGNSSNAYGAVGILLTGGVIAFVLAIILFRWDRHNANQQKHPLLALIALVPYILGVLVL